MYIQTPFSIWTVLRYRAGAACGLAEIELVCLRNGRVLPYHEWCKLEEGYLVYRAGSSKLGNIAFEAKAPRWRQRPKGHNLEHLVYDFHMLNPKYCSNYLDEDFVRRSKRLAMKSDAKVVSKHVLMRYAIAACLRWTGMTPKWQKMTFPFPRLDWCGSKQILNLQKSFI